jgi:hypothetical protein
VLQDDCDALGSDYAALPADAAQTWCGIFNGRLIGFNRSAEMLACNRLADGSGLAPLNDVDPGHIDVPLQVRAADSRSFPWWEGGQWRGDQQRQQKQRGTTGKDLICAVPSCTGHAGDATATAPRLGCWFFEVDADREKCTRAPSAARAGQNGTTAGERTPAALWYCVLLLPGSAVILTLA